MISEDFNRAMEIVTERTGVTRKQILARTKKQHIVLARQTVCWLMRLRKHRLHHIAKLMKRDHGTVIHSCKAINLALEMDSDFREMWPELLGRNIRFKSSEKQQENKRKLMELVEDK